MYATFIYVRETKQTARMEFIEHVKNESICEVGIASQRVVEIMRISN